MSRTEASSTERFRVEVHQWLTEVLPTLPDRPPRDDWTAQRAFDSVWQRTMYDGGYAGLGLPEKYGGRPASIAEQFAFLEECARAGAPPHGCNLVGITHAAPTILTEASEELRQRLIPPILRGEEIWCQGFSETEAGSDLAALRCSAVQDGDHYVINGHKIWTTHGHVADWCELLVRTDPTAPRHKGITYLALPMHLDGITVRPIRTLAGEREYSQVTFDNVRCPVNLRVGEENNGWHVAMVTFAHERGATFIYDLIRAQQAVNRLADNARQVVRAEGSAWDDAGVRRDIGRVAAQLDGMWALTRRAISDAATGHGPGAEASVAKLFGTETLQRLGDVAIKVFGPAALTLDNLPGLCNGDFVHERLVDTRSTIAGGTSQVQRNIIAERLLGLPRESA